MIISTQLMALLWINAIPSILVIAAAGPPKISRMTRGLNLNAVPLEQILVSLLVLMLTVWLAFPSLRDKLQGLSKYPALMKLFVCILFWAQVSLLALPAIQSASDLSIFVAPLLTAAIYATFVCFFTSDQSFSLSQKIAKP
jgi:cellulose synthase/poly-beta-1,6-N-acetylglucosamine synthase-like glycosyltransferase